MTPVERAARALFEYEPGPYGDCVEWAVEEEFGWRSRVAEVHLVLAAIREPSTEEVRRAVASEEVVAWGDYREFWRAMIDTMLDEQAG